MSGLGIGLGLEARGPATAAAGLVYVGSNKAKDPGTVYQVSLLNLQGGVGGNAQAGDLVIVANGFAGTSDQSFSGGFLPTPATYTPIADLYSNDFRDANLGVHYKRMGATPDTYVEIALSKGGGANGGACAVVHVWRNVDPTTPLDVAAVTATGINAARPDAPAITPTTAGTVILAIGHGTGDTSPVAFTAPSGMENHVVETDFGLSFGAQVAIASYSGWTSGPYDPAAWTGGESTVNDAWAAVTIALRPAS